MLRPLGVLEVCLLARCTGVWICSFHFEVVGFGGHGAMPHQTRDPITACAAAVQNINAFVARENNYASESSGFVSVTQIQVGLCTRSPLPSPGHSAHLSVSPSLSVFPSLPVPCRFNSLAVPLCLSLSLFPRLLLYLSRTLCLTPLSESLHFQYFRAPSPAHSPFLCCTGTSFSHGRTS